MISNDWTGFHQICKYIIAFGCHNTKKRLILLFISIYKTNRLFWIEGIKKSKLQVSMD